jgi:hypothetical protein
MPNSLAAFALVAHEFERTGDPILGLIPLFEPIVAERAGQFFEPAWFAGRFTELYGYSMSAVVAQALADRLVQAQLLVEEKIHDGIARRYRTAASGDKRVDEAQVLKLANAFTERAAPLLQSLGKAIPRIDIERGFFERIARPEFTGIFLVPERKTRARSVLSLRTSAVTQNEWSIAQALDYLTADFVLHISETSPEAFGDLSAIAFGALVADAVAALALPGQRTSQVSEPLRVVIDGPLLLDALDVNSPEHRAYAIGLLDLFKQAGLRLATFDHVLDEMRTLIRKTLEHFQKGEGYGPLAAQLRINRSHGVYATYIADALEDEVRNLGVSILRSRIYDEARYANYFPNERLDSLRNALGDAHHQLERRIVDARSIATVARLKGERLDSASVLEAGTVFVTRNPILAKGVNRFLSIGRSEPSPRFTCLTDGQLAGLLWFVQGSTGIELSRMRLIANCATAVTPRLDVIAQMAATLERLSPEQGKQFAVLMQDSRASLCPMRQTAGFASEVTGEIAEHTLEQMRLVAAEPLVAEVRSEAAKEILAHQREADRARKRADEKEEASRSLEGRLAAATATEKREIENARLKVAQLEFSEEQLNNEVRLRAEDARLARERARRAVDDGYARVAAAGTRTKGGIMWGLRLTFLLVLLLSLIPQTSHYLLVVIGQVAFAVAGLWLFTPWFERFVDRCVLGLVRSRYDAVATMEAALGLSEGSES